MTNHIVLFEPEIPANTGNIARTCAGTNTVLHLIKPYGFLIDDKHVKRAGLDYWNKVNIVEHDNLESFMATLTDKDHLFLLTKFADQAYSDVDYRTFNGDDIYLMFGKETTGLPENFMLEHVNECLRIPMSDNIRALNLSNTAALTIYEVLRQLDFPGLEKTHHYPNDKLKDI